MATTTAEAKRERRIAALEAASRVYAGEGDTYAYQVTDMADKFVDWLEQ